MRLHFEQLNKECISFMAGDKLVLQPCKLGDEEAFNNLANPKDLNFIIGTNGFLTLVGEKTRHEVYPKKKETEEIQIKRGPAVKAPHSDKLEGIEAFQVIEFTINYFGKKIVSIHDTKIMGDGRQLVIGGCGFIPHNTDVNELIKD